MSEIRVRPNQQNSLKVRVGQQNAIKLVSSVSGNFVGIASYAYESGISSYSSLSGIASYSVYSGISSYSSLSGIASYSVYSGISSYSSLSGLSSSSLNILGGLKNNLIYQQSPGITTFIPEGIFGQILYTNILGKPEWISQQPAELVNGLTVINQNEIIGFANSISTLRIVGIGLSASLGVTPSVANLEIIEIDGGEY